MMSADSNFVVDFQAGDGVESAVVLREPRTPNRDVRPFDAFLERFGPFESVNGGFGGSRTCSINSKFAQKSPTFPFVLMKS